jgi:hypothetical protein
MAALRGGSVPCERGTPVEREGGGKREGEGGRENERSRERERFRVQGSGFRISGFKVWDVGFGCSV